MEGAGRLQKINWGAAKSNLESQRENDSGSWEMRAQFLGELGARIPPAEPHYLFFDFHEMNEKLQKNRTLTIFSFLIPQPLQYLHT